jgi:hypothetical protein
VRAQDGQELGNERRRRRRHQQRRDRAVVHAQAGGEGQRRLARVARGGEEDLFLHADVLQDPGPELPERHEVDLAGDGDGPSQKGVEPPMIGREEAVQRAVHRPTPRLVVEASRRKAAS